MSLKPPTRAHVRTCTQGDADKPNDCIEDCICRKDELTKVLRLMCLQSLVNGGLKPKVYDMYLLGIIQTSVSESWAISRGCFFLFCFWRALLGIIQTSVSETRRFLSVSIFIDVFAEFGVCLFVCSPWLQRTHAFLRLNKSNSQLK
jgi:hypothetical protein